MTYYTAIPTLPPKTPIISAYTKSIRSFRKQRNHSPTFHPCLNILYAKTSRQNTSIKDTIQPYMKNLPKRNMHSCTTNSKPSTIALEHSSAKKLMKKYQPTNAYSSKDKPALDNHSSYKPSIITH